MVKDQVEDIGFAAYDAEWYNYPSKLQKYNLVMMSRSQEEVNFTGIGMMFCNLEYFGKVRLSP